MQKTVNQIREIEIIEAELASQEAGILALNINDENISQFATTFLYLDKNIYVFFNTDNEVYDSIRLDAPGSFTVVKQGKVKKGKKSTSDSAYNFFSITITGLIKKVEEAKTLEEIRQGYLKKYKVENSGSSELSDLSSAIILDSEEIQAFEETGG